jgi:hypothetical protein
MFNMKQKKIFVYAALLAILVSVTATSFAQARDVSPPPAADDSSTPKEDVPVDTPVLIMTLDGNATVPESQDDQPNLYQTQDAPATVDDNSTRVIAQDDASGSQENVLIAPQASPDLTVPMVSLAGLAAVIAVVGAFLFVRTRKTTR